MEATLLAAAGIASALYFALVTSNLLGMRRSVRGKSGKRPRVSVLVAARDEAQNLTRCLDALLAQDYAGVAPLEIVVVDDRSRDATGEILAEYAAAPRGTRVRAVRVDVCPPGVSPKMFALERALEIADGEILCVTDADCAPPSTWVSELVAHFEADVGFVAGPVLRLPRDGARSWIGDLDSVASIAGTVVGAGGIAWGLPWTCAGANLAYRRETLDAIGGYTVLHFVASGDDDLLMLRIAQAGWRIAYALDPRACVETLESPRLARFARQQTRHHSRFRHHPPRVQAMSLAVFSYYVWFLTGPLLAMGSVKLGFLWLATSALRFVLDWAAIAEGARRIGAELSGAAILRCSLLFPAVVVLTAMFGVRGRFTWKGQRFGEATSSR